MTYTDAQIWLMIVIMGIATYLIRFSFLGLVGDRDLPDWALRHLRYTPVAVLPGLVAPLVLWPEANDGNPEPIRIIAAIATVTFARYFKSMFAGIIAGGASLVGLNMLFG